MSTAPKTLLRPSFEKQTVNSHALRERCLPTVLSIRFYSALVGEPMRYAYAMLNDLNVVYVIRPGS